MKIANLHITPDSHRRFAAWSGDLNPMHVDAEAARAMEPGGLLAFGMDAVLRSLEALAENDSLPADIAGLRARFLKWVYVDDELQLQGSEEGGEGKFLLRAREEQVMTLDVHRGAAVAPHAQESDTHPCSRRQSPADLSLESMEGKEGVACAADAALSAAFFPRLTGMLGASAVSELAACSYIIGMEAPGLYSMSMRYNLQITSAAKVAPSHGLSYRVNAVDLRFRKITVHIQGTHIAGTLEAFVRAH